MRWSREAEAAIQKVPFFVRKKVIQRVEAHVMQSGKAQVELSDVDELKKKFLSKGGMEKEVKGYEIASCFGGSGCPNAANPVARLAADLEKIFERENLPGFLKSVVKGDLKFHHEFRVSLSECPNACSRPQIADIGIMGVVLPGISGEACSLCGSCAEACDEGAITLDTKIQRPIIREPLCLNCAKCIRVCPTGTLTGTQKGFRVMLGGKLGRHPRLAMEVPGIHSHDEVLAILKNCLKFYKKTSKKGERFSHLLSSLDQIR
ncbi:MAG: 4Fe-4S dicluster domain-containing protein [Desulfobacula sp.]|nr:4Fe-4S dicluster domain-containing protein [Desulfobacula sp.]